LKATILDIGILLMTFLKKFSTLWTGVLKRFELNLVRFPEPW
jgi:hypothetical protein